MGACVGKMVAGGAPPEGSSLELTEREARCYKCQLKQVSAVARDAAAPYVRTATERT